MTFSPFSYEAVKQCPQPSPRRTDPATADARNRRQNHLAEAGPVGPRLSPHVGCHAFNGRGRPSPRIEGVHEDRDEVRDEVDGDGQAGNQPTPGVASPRREGCGPWSTRIPPILTLFLRGVRGPR